MRGPRVVRHAIIEYMRNAVPAMAAKAESSWGETLSFDLPEHYEAYEPDGISHGSRPVLAVSVQDAEDFEVVDITPLAEEQYRVTYSIRIYVWHVTPESHDGDVPGDARVRTAQARDDLGTVIRACILDKPSLGNSNAFEVDASSLREEYSEVSPVPNPSGRRIAGVFFSFDVKVDESQFRLSVGQVPEEGVEVEADLLGDA